MRGPDTAQLPGVGEPARDRHGVQRQRGIPHEIPCALESKLLTIVVNRDARRAPEHAREVPFAHAGNGGELAILYCFTFLYFCFVGAGVWSLDEMRSPAGRAAAAPRARR